MKKKIAAAFVGVSLTLGAAAEDSGFPSGVLSAPGGRFVFGQINQMARDQFLLDTQTGRIWQVVCAKSETPAASKSATISNCVERALQPMALVEDNGVVMGNFAPPIGPSRK